MVSAANAPHLKRVLKGDVVADQARATHGLEWFAIRLTDGVDRLAAPVSSSSASASRHIPHNW